MNKLIFVRHGETETNEKGLTHKTNDSATLTTKGKGQINDAARALADYQIDHIFCSDEKRTEESASIIADSLEIDIETDPNLKERNWGDYEGREWSEIKTVLDKFSLKERYEFAPPNGESWQQFEQRIYTVIENIIKNFSNKNIVIVTHGGVIRAIIPRLLNLPLEESFKYDPVNASITVINYDNGQFKAEIINDSKHLTNNY